MITEGAHIAVVDRPSITPSHRATNLPAYTVLQSQLLNTRLDRGVTGGGGGAEEEFTEASGCAFAREKEVESGF